MRVHVVPVPTGVHEGLEASEVRVRRESAVTCSAAVALRAPKDE
jgi:hypothetical protein